MSELTYATGDIQECPFCTFKHLSDAEAHAPSDIKPIISKIREDLAKKIDIDKASYDEIRKYEHILEDYLTVLREKRKELEPHRGCSGIVNPGENPNPELALAETKCEWREEKVKPKEYFHPESFRTLCPECPQARCALCPPELACATRIIIGCKKEEWDTETKRCRVSTEKHVIYHGSPKIKA
ncbi:MAG: hypothetical protein QXK51_11495 [Candidatus Methanomethylicia archaeon]